MKKNDKKYPWNFFTVGKVSRVSITTGDDIAHLKDLDQKLWTVLSCPVKGLEFDEKTLELLDTDHDGKIHSKEIISAANWLTHILKNPSILIQPKEEFPLSELNVENEEGEHLYNSAKQILANLGLNKDTISKDDTADSIAIFEKTRFNGDGIITEKTTDDEELKTIITQCKETIGTCQDRSGDMGINAEQLEQFYTACREYDHWKSSATAQADSIFPYGDQTEEALQVCLALEAKINDYFMRCKLAVFNDEYLNALNVSSERVSTLCEKDLATYNEEIANFPIARITTAVTLPLTEGINPAWQKTFDQLKKIVLCKNFAQKESLTEAEWNQILDSFDAYKSWKSEKKGEVVESLGDHAIHHIVTTNREADLLNLIEEDKKLEAEANAIGSVHKLTHLYHNFYTLLRNYITFVDFYVKDPTQKAIFQAGTLFIDQRSCDLCLKINDMAKQNSMAALSGMFILFCECTSKVKNEKMTIAAIVTDGDVNDLREGKNGIFYDRNGDDWDATVVKIIDNPISVRQAFWSPYRKLARFIEDQAQKMAADKDAKANDKLTDLTTKSVEQVATSTENQDKNSKKQIFDIAKFAGIFAAISIAIGAIGTFLTKAFSGFISLKWWQMIVAIAVILLVISGPATIMAWLKLRKRDLSPILNANGWAINSRVIVNIKFGATLTHLAKYPKANIKLPIHR